MGRAYCLYDMCANYNRNAQCTMHTMPSQYSHILPSKGQRNFSVGTKSKGTKQQVKETQMKISTIFFFFFLKKYKNKWCVLHLSHSIYFAISYTTNIDTVRKHEHRDITQKLKWKQKQSSFNVFTYSLFSLTDFVCSKWIFAKQKSLASVKSGIAIQLEWYGVWSMEYTYRKR